MGTRFARIWSFHVLPHILILNTNIYLVCIRLTASKSWLQLHHLELTCKGKITRQQLEWKWGVTSETRLVSCRKDWWSCSRLGQHAWLDRHVHISWVFRSCTRILFWWCRWRFSVFFLTFWCNLHLVFGHGGIAWHTATIQVLRRSLHHISSISLHLPSLFHRDDFSCDSNSSIVTLILLLFSLRHWSLISSSFLERASLWSPKNTNHFFLLLGAFFHFLCGLPLLWEFLIHSFFSVCRSLLFYW